MTLLGWLSAFLVTQAFEMPVYVYALRERPWPKRLAIAFGASAITHPLVFLGAPLLIESVGYGPYVAIAETFAIVVEAVYLRAFGVSNPLAWSLGANAASWLSGRLLRLAIGWP